MGVSNSSFNGIEEESKLINDLVLSAKNGNFGRVWEIIGEPNKTKKAHLLNCIPDSRRWGVIHQVTFWNKKDVLNKLLKYEACDADMRTKRCTSECGDTSGMRALDIARAFKRPDMDRILSAHKCNMMGQKLYTFQRELYLGLLSNTIASYKATFHPGVITPFATGLEILHTIWMDMNRSKQRFDAVKKQVCDSMFVVSEANAIMIENTTTKEDFYKMIVKAYSIETNFLYNYISMAMRRQTSTNYQPTGDDLALGPYTVMYQMLLLFWDKLTPESGTTYRQMKMKMEDVNMYTRGTVFYWQSVVSSTKDEVNAQSFPTVENSPGENIVLFVIDNSAKCAWQPKNIEKYASYSESERTYPAGAKFCVMSSSEFCEGYYRVKLSLLAH
ncbi:uncharacterized protein LOC132712763 [Ruditapes philippinarum]|uniref:uncharacterized protein LOC132712763 n=1 Tax=Ruditapes philippinarum TaxID=129788 RepID=UPI00295BE615|nr:uncharacterized protein LOC132712763 [Ruditapes philippinarum]